MKENRNPVVFRVGGSGTVIALFPEDEASPGHCVSFKLVDQPEVKQMVINYRKAIEMSRPAKTSELQELLGAIRKMGMAPVIRQKFRRKK